MPQMGWTPRKKSREADSLALRGEFRLQNQEGFHGAAGILNADEISFRKLEQDGKRYLVVETHDGHGGKTRRVLGRDAIESLLDFMVSEEF